MVSFCYTGYICYASYGVLKRLFDITVSLIGILVLSPVLLLVALLIKLDSSGPIFYRGVRIGKDGRAFRIYKFRTMVVNAEKLGGPSTAGDDARLTKIGKLIRKYKLDELPQLFNVLEGDMSFVGPRPEVPLYVNMYTEEEKAILTVKPGITDWASLWNPDEGSILAGSADPEKAYMEKIRPIKLKLQLEYVKKHSFLTDIKIIFLTILKIIKR